MFGNLAGATAHVEAFEGELRAVRPFGFSLWPLVGPCCADILCQTWHMDDRTEQGFELSVKVSERGTIPLI